MFVATSDQFVDRRAKTGLRWQVAELVQHEHVSGQEWSQQPLTPEAGGGPSELVGQVLGSDEPSGGAELDVLGGDADRQHGLAQAWRTDQRQRARLLDERGIEIAQDHLTLQLRSEAEV